MADKTPFLVTVVDAAGADSAVDKVTFTGPGGSKELTHPPFTFDLVAAGDAQVTVEKASHHTYQFAFKITATGDDFTVRFDNTTMIDAPRMGSLSKVHATSGSNKTSKNLLKLTIAKAREVLLVVGWDYKSGSINQTTPPAGCTIPTSPTRSTTRR